MLCLGQWLLTEIPVLPQVVHAAEGILGALEVAGETLIPMEPLKQD